MILIKKIRTSNERLAKGQGRRVEVRGYLNDTQKYADGMSASFNVWIRTKISKKIGGWKSCKNGGGVITENFAKKIFYCSGKKVGDDFISFFIFYFFIKHFKNAQF